MLATVLAFAPTFHAQRLPLKLYSSADGMASSVIHNIAYDSRGFMWIAARGGLTRYDGLEFIAFDFDEALNAPLVHCVLESRSKDRLWIAADNGLYSVDTVEVTSVVPIMEESVGAKHRKLNARKVANSSFWSIYEEPDGHLLGVTSTGLYESVDMSAPEVAFRRVSVSTAAAELRQESFRDFREGADGSLWLAGDYGLARRLPSGRWMTYKIRGRTASESTTVRQDSSGRIWYTDRSNVYVLVPEPESSLSGLADKAEHEIQVRDVNVGKIGSIEYPKMPGEMVRLVFDKQNRIADQTAPVSADEVFQSRDGRIWIPTPLALYVLSGDTYVRLEDANHHPGLARRIVEDGDGDLWFGTFNGLFKYSANGLTTYNSANGLSDPVVHNIQQMADGAILVMHGNGSLSRVTAQGVETRQLKLEPDSRFSWTSTQALLDENEDVWSLQTRALWRFPHERDLAATATHGIKEGIGNPLFTGRTFYRAFRDSRGNVWFSTIHDDPNRRGLIRYNVRTGEWHDQLDTEGYPKGSPFPASMAEAPDGDLWFGFYGGGGLLKYSDGKFKFYKVQDGVPPGANLSMLFDRKGRLWVGSTESGVSRVDDPSAEVLSFVRFTDATGLTSNNVRCLTQDLAGNVYAGTVRGVSRIDGENGRVRQLTSADGLASDFVQAALRDSNGVLWFGTWDGLSRYVPKEDRKPPVGPTFISDLEIAGKRFGVSAMGQRLVENLETEYSENNLKIGFFSVGNAASLRYQYLLEGSGTDWSEPAPGRSITFAGLSPGRYNFLVRAVNDQGETSENPASVQFTIRPPIWRTWWFIGLIMLLVAGAVFALDRYRVAKTRQVEQALIRSQENESRFRTLADTASDAIITIDESSNIVFVNEAVEKVFGYKPEEIIGKAMPMLMPERMRDGHHAGLARYISSGNRNIDWSGVSLPGKHKDGHEIPLEVSFGEFEREGKRFFTGIARDVSERVRAERKLQEAREERLRELERVRTRIASDLHDDIGSSLTQIAVLSEVARGQAAHVDGPATNNGPLDRIKTVSRELVAAMSDIVWAINPQKDHLHDLVLRMRRFGSDLFTARGITFEFKAPDVDTELQMGVNIRREVFAIFKEASNNAAKYSQCTTVRAEFEIDNDRLVLRIDDDGNGFDVGHILSGGFRPELGGNGISSMRKRAADLDGTFEIRSAVGEGTSVVLTVPLHSQNISGNGSGAKTP